MKGPVKGSRRLLYTPWPGYRQERELPRCLSAGISPWRGVTSHPHGHAVCEAGCWVTPEAASALCSSKVLCCSL